MHASKIASSPSRCGTLSACAVKKSPTSCGCWPLLPLPLPLYHAAVALPAGPLPGVTERPGPPAVELARCPAAGLLGAGLEDGLPYVLPQKPACARALLGLTPAAALLLPAPAEPGGLPTAYCWPRSVLTPAGAAIQ
jgi:hypothetical protein